MSPQRPLGWHYFSCTASDGCSVHLPGDARAADARAADASAALIPEAEAVQDGEADLEISATELFQKELAVART